ncbi:MAG: glycoside hydrolase family 95 protein [Draconibacterium sp.]|nr:glycoside hydrolase family 95 protein [Draconibacterium sp.]
MKNILLLFSIILFISCAEKEKDAGISFGKHDLVSNSLAKTWDEGIPLGNGIIGALVWQ